MAVLKCVRFFLSDLTLWPLRFSVNFLISMASFKFNMTRSRICVGNKIRELSKQQGSWLLSGGVNVVFHFEFSSTCTHVIYSSQEAPEFKPRLCHLVLHINSTFKLRPVHRGKLVFKEDSGTRFGIACNATRFTHVWQECASWQSHQPESTGISSSTWHNVLYLYFWSRELCLGLAWWQHQNLPVSN